MGERAARQTGMGEEGETVKTGDEEGEGGRLTGRGPGRRGGC